MDTIAFHVFGFLLCALVIVYAGSRLARYGDRIAEISGLGKAWIGLILMAAVTSLPELMTGISSVAIINAPDLAAGDVFGSCVFNLLILSFLDAWIQKPLTSLVKSSHLFAGLLSMILIGLSGLAILTSSSVPDLLWISPVTLILVVIYILAVRGVYQFERSPSSEEAKAEQTEDRKELKKVLLAYLLHALIVVAAAAFLPFFGERIAILSGLGNTFFGTLFLAASTSLPELVVSFSAVRFGSYDLAVGNLLGSNIFNIFILAIDDMFFIQGPLFSFVSKDHLESVLIVIIMTAVVGLGLMVKPTRKFWRLSFDTMIIAILYLSLVGSLYLRS